METSWHESFADRYPEWSAGRTVIGIDSSPAMLTQTRAEADD